MGFNILDIMNAATMAEVGKNKDYQEITLNYQDIVVTKHNKYSMDGLDDLATGISMDGLQEPLVLGRVNGEYWLHSGHRRLAAIKMLVAEGKTEFENIPCRYKDMTEIEFRISLLVGNTFNRKMTDYDLMTQAADWKEVLTQARKEGLLILEAGQRVRDYVAAVMGETVPKIRTLNTISDNATPEVKEQFQKGNLGITAAVEAAKADKDTQKEIAQAAEDKGGLGAEEIKTMTEEKKKHRKTLADETREANVSDEADGTHKGIIDVYNGHTPLARGYKVKYTDAWCATFVSAVAIKCGLTGIIPTECGCGQMIELFKALGEWQESDSRTPTPGDVIFYDWDDSGAGDNTGWPDHVGIVESVSGENIVVIEGNKNNAVGRRTIPVNGRYIRGYGVPKYDKETTAPPQPSGGKSVAAVAKEVIAGKWGNGADRKNRLEAAGYNYQEVQNQVNALLSGGATKPTKTVAQVAKEVIAGKWGNGKERKNRLEAAGYNYQEVQNKVNQLLR